MALAKKCDRCGRFYEPISKNIRRHMVNSIGLISRQNTNNGHTVLDVIDCCESCLMEFEQWLNKGTEGDTEND